MNEMNIDCQRLIEQAIARSIRLKRIPSIAFNETIYYDEHNNAVVREKIFNPNQSSYDIYQYEYDDFEHITVLTHTFIVDNQVYAYENKTFFEYIYNEENHISQKTTLNDAHIPCNLIKYYYKENKLHKMEEYDKRGCHPSSDSKPTQLPLIRIHIYDYAIDGQLVMETIRLGSGDISCFLLYEESNLKGKLMNPFQTKYSWSIDSIDNECFEVTIHETSFHCDILKDIVDAIHPNYPNCSWILLHLSHEKKQSFDEEKICDYMEYCKKYKQIMFDYI